MTLPLTDVRPLPDHEDRECIRTSLDETLIVEAAAGTGKTTALIGRIVATLAAGRARIDEIAAVTFTEKAAGELKLRLREDLERAYRQALTGAPAEAARLAEALAHLEEAHISTIHGFCADLLRERPLEAGVDPRFEVLMEPAAMLLLDQAFDAWLRQALEAPGEGLRRILRRRSRSLDEGGVIDQLRRAVGALAEWRDFPAPWRREPFDRAEGISACLAAIRTFAELSASPSNGKDNLYVDTEPIRRFARHHLADPSVMAHASTIGAGAEREAGHRSDGVTPITAPGFARDDDALEAALLDLARERSALQPRTGSSRTYGAGVDRAAVRAAHEALCDALTVFVEASEADIAACLQQELWPCLARYERLKQEQGALDFVDLLLRTRELIVRDRSVRADFQRRFARIFVDEFQDTDPIQAEILTLLAADDPDVTDWRAARLVPGKLFIVGDPKQAIYRFRRADVGTYWAVRELILAQPKSRACQLRACFRIVPSLQHAINAAFEPVMRGQLAEEQASYVALEPVRDDPAEQPTLVALPVPRPYAKRYVSAQAIEASLPDAVGAFVAWLVQDSGWTVAETGPDGVERRVPVQARHVALLFRRFVSWGEDVTRPYLDALEARGVPHLLVGGRTFRQREEVEALRVTLAAIERPDDELSVYASLRSLLFAIPDHVLLAYRAAAPTRRLDPWHPLDPATPEAQAAEQAVQVGDGVVGGTFADVVEALALIRRLHARRNRVPAHETVHAVLGATRAHAALALRPGGDQALANALHIVELARQYEAAGGLSFRGFVEQLDDERLTDASEAPLLEEGSDGVRLMTVHKAKGLEFPVVVLADITCGLTGRTAGRYLDASRGLCAQRLAGCTPHELLEQAPLEMARERAEAHRLAYVAATRARDLLVVPAVGDDPYPGEKHGERWIDVLNPVLYPPLDARRHPRPAPGCPEFSGDTVLERPDFALPGPTTVLPGAFTMGQDGAMYDVVWWDPQQLHLDATLVFGKRQLAMVERLPTDERVREGLAEEAAWNEARRAAREAGARPQHDVVRVTTAAAARTAAAAGATAPDGTEGVPAEIAPDAAIDVVSAGVRGARPRGRAFGALVHDVLSVVPLDAGRDAVRALAQLQARLAPPSEDAAIPPDDDEALAAVTDAVVAALAHPLLSRAREAARRGACRREWPLMLRLDDGRLVEGTLDLAFEEPSGWTVVDFKTDEPGEASLDVYRRQVALYCRALRTASARPVTGVILQV
jgi:ATP-dependent helicase/nuclease subunit A